MGRSDDKQGVRLQTLESDVPARGDGSTTPAADRTVPEPYPDLVPTTSKAELGAAHETGPSGAHGTDHGGQECWLCDGAMLLETAAGKDRWPCDGPALLELLDKTAALTPPEAVLSRLRRLPAGHSFDSAQDMWAAVQSGMGPRRF